MVKRGLCFLTPEDARAIDWANTAERFRVLGEILQTMHLVSSAKCLCLIKELLNSQRVPDGVAGREAFMIKRDGLIQQDICREPP